MINALEAKKQGYTSAEAAPEPDKCQFCGSALYPIGLVSVGRDKYIWRWIAPKRCTCDQAATYWAAADERKRQAEQAQRQADADARLKARIDRMIGESGMRGRFLQRTFDTFKRDTQNSAAYATAKAYADGFANKVPRRIDDGRMINPSGRNGLYLVGSVGTGKTHLSAAIANQLLAQGTPVICMTMIDLLARIKQTFDRQGESEDAIMGLYETVPLLVIDDMGKEQPTEWGIKTVYAIVNARYEAYMPTIVTTNYTNDDLIARMTPRGGDSMTATATLDRLYEMCEAVPMFWESWRSRI